MAWVLDQCLVLLHPFMPFVTEDLWGQTATRAKLLVHADWPTQGADLVDPAADREMAWVIGLIEEIRSARAQMHVPVGLQLPLLRIEAGPEARAAWDRNAALIQRIARVERLDDAASVPKGAVTIPAEGALFALPLAGVIDVAAEQGRLNKALEKLEKELAGLNGRLSNPKFAESAPEEVVEETREAAAARSEEAAKLRAALDRLAAMA
jgi:valyl-tRNA synthetase